VGSYKIGPVPEEDDRMVPFFIEEEEELDEAKLSLENLGKSSKKFTYIYDFGDYWEHVIHIGQRGFRAGEPNVICTDGDGASPWEDCGGAYGYEHMIEVLEDPEDAEYENVLGWTGDTFFKEFDKDSINSMLDGILTRPKRERWF
jgi:hypothetical protein